MLLYLAWQTSGTVASFGQTNDALFTSRKSFIIYRAWQSTNEPAHDKTHSKTHATMHSLIIVFAERSMIAKDPSFLHEYSDNWNDSADTKADLSLRWAHMQFCWICRALAQKKENQLSLDVRKHTLGYMPAHLHSLMRIFTGCILIAVTAKFLYTTKTRLFKNIENFTNKTESFQIQILIFFFFFIFLLKTYIVGTR